MLNGWLNKVIGWVVSVPNREAARGSGGAMEVYTEGVGGQVSGGRVRLDRYLGMIWEGVQ